jgi:hypothetical protein
MYDMSTTLTVRIDSRQQRALARRAAAQKKSLSVLVREILDGALDERPLGQRTGALRGRLSLAKPGDARRKQIKARNWRS